MNEYNYMWILDKDRTPVQCDDVHKWEEWYRDRSKRDIKKTTLYNGTFVSSVFLGIDHGVLDREPILYETMVFETYDKAKGLGDHLDCIRSTNEADTLIVHEEFCEKYK